MEHQADNRRWTYSSARQGLLGRASEAYYLLSAAASGPEGKIRATIANVEATRARVKKHTGVELSGKRMLDIGPGQQLRHLRAFSVGNQVEGIDMDIIPQEFKLSDYLTMLQQNSLTRVGKTLARKVLGVDRRFLSGLAKELGVKKFEVLPLHRMDAAAMSYAEATFDCVYSYSVFEHIDRPEAALEEVRRVLKPGGVMYISIHLYTSHSGQHDPKMLVQEHPEPPYWPHLRPAHEASVSRSAYLNEIRLPEWKAMFERVFPGVTFEHERHDQLKPQLAELKAKGELAEYDDDELLTLNLIAIWKKPEAA